METTQSSIMADASALLGRALTGATDLGGSQRSTVLRARTSDGDSVVIKRYSAGERARAVFGAESSGLAFTDLGPRLLAADGDAPMIVMEDLGAHPSLADRLLGDDPQAAEAALLEWAGAYGRMAAASVGREHELARLIEEYGRGNKPESEDASLPRHCAAFVKRLVDSGIAVPAGLEEELDGLTGVLLSGAFSVFSPGDICPDNNLLTPDGLRVLDFEGASYHSVFLDAAYATMPFATCWCVYRLPAATARRIEERYRAEVTAAFPELADDAVWRPGLLAAVVVWTVAMSAIMLKDVQEGDAPMHSPEIPLPTVRQVLHYRWNRLRELLASSGALPATASCMSALLEATAGWRPDPLPLYPALEAAGREAAWGSA
jgi:hypothetical protein